MIGIPVELGWLAWTVRPYWPDADEDALRRCAQAWRAAADGLRGVLPDADRAGGGAVSALDGPTADAVRAVWDGFTVGDDGHIEVLASACAGLAGVCDGTADVVERAKYQLVRAVLVLAGELTVLAAIAPATAGLSLLAGAVAARATRDRAHDIATRAADAVARTVERSGAGDRLGHLGTVLRARRIPHPGGGPTVRPDLGAGPGGLLGVDGRSDPPPLAGSDPADIRPRSTLAGHAVPSPPAVVGLAPAAGPPPAAGGSAVSAAGVAGSGPGLPGSPAVVPASTGPAGRSQGALAPSTGSAAPSGPGANRPGPARADPSRPAAPSPPAQPGVTPAPPGGGPGPGAGQPGVDRLATLAPDPSGRSVDGVPGLLFGPPPAVRAAAGSRPAAPRARLEIDEELVRAFLDRAATAEAELTPVLDGIAEAAGGALLGREHRRKPADAVRRKLAAELDDCPGSSVEDVLGRFRDAVRYTVGLPAEGYAAGAERVLAALADAGYEPVRCRNKWADPDGYPGIVSFWRAGAQLFEVWLHTAESYARWIGEAGPVVPPPDGAATVPVA